MCSGHAPHFSKSDPHPAYVQPLPPFIIEKPPKCGIDLKQPISGQMIWMSGDLIYFCWEGIRKTRPSILCVTHQMRRKKGKDPVGFTLRYEMLNHKVIPIGTWWYLVSIQRYWLVLGSTRSVWAGTAWHLVVQGQYMAVLVGTGWYLVVLGQYRAVLVDIWCYWVSMEWNWSIHDYTGSVEGSTG